VSLPFLHKNKVNNFFNFKNKKVLILGGSSGFGKKISELFLDLGAEVFIVARNKRRLEKIYNDSINKKKTHIYKTDINSEHEMNNFISDIKKKTKYLNIIIYCCGTNIRESFVNLQYKNFNDVLQTNFISALKTYKKLFFLVKSKKQFTRIINFCSIFSTTTIQSRTSYSTSKAALLMLTKNLALEWSKYNTTVNAISPGPFLTKINLPVLKNKKEYEKFCEKIPLNRFGNVEEILTAVLFLSSEKSSYVTGSEIIVDGGWTI